MNPSSSIRQGLRARWRWWRQTPGRERPMRRPAFIGPLLRPVWPAWGEALESSRCGHEPQRSDPPFHAQAGSCGWFESSHDLHNGLEVREDDRRLEEPGADVVARAMRFG